ncbi:tonB-system energizer ExbB [Pleomorphomonas carboxyditropha]|uniref:Biopolymer transport protein ExbB n=1 Tax=Pleomorphomonas carboxyditropha TaxID=2023338 RepID=A0A2G9WPE9_9HYPH|nr:tonB-system energizer ExbB [Pleomorphomonas carboxyditropha]PIO96192.1 tonB-system energizer ExbB [Pleomorphomonas carboxyditropha]
MMNPESIAAAGAAVVTLPHDLTPFGMFMAADLVVKAVMVGLIAASLITWVILVGKVLELSALGRSARRGVAVVAAEAGIAGLVRRPHLPRPLAAMLAEIGEEVAQTGAEGTGSTAAGGLVERVRSRLSRLEAAAGRRAMTGTGLLATIGSTAPFVGLFGTVWGIMNAFVGISESQTTNLAVVAPGIAEALLATATGLVAAIPAVVVYNHLARRTTAFRAEMTDLSEGLIRTLSRDLETGRLDVGSLN